MHQLENRVDVGLDIFKLAALFPFDPGLLHARIKWNQIKRMVLGLEKEKKRLRWPDPKKNYEKQIKDRKKKKRHNNNIQKCLIRLAIKIRNPFRWWGRPSHLHMLAFSSRMMSIQKKQKNDGESHWEREVLFSFLGPWRERGGWEGERGWRTEKSVRSLVLEHHGPRVKQLANFWGYDAYIDDEPQRNGGKMRMSWLYIYIRETELTWL